MTASDRLNLALSSFINVFSPRTALRMDIARVARSELLGRGYDAAKTTRFNKNRSVTDGNANEELLRNLSLSKLRKLSRDACRNNPLARSIKKALIAHIVGTGYTLQANALTKTGKPLDAFNDKIERLWRIWAENKEHCDVRRKKTLNQFLRQAVGQMLETGEYIIHKTTEDDKRFPFRIESIESDLLDDQFNEGNIVGGILVNGSGRPLKYYFSKSTPNINDSQIRTDRYEVEADKIIHCYIEERPGQLRGEPWFAPVLDLLATTSRAIQAELYTLEIQACLAVLWTSKSGLDGKFLGSQTSTTNDDNNRIGKVTPGMMMKIPGADDIKVVDPARPGNSFAPFIDKIVQYVAAAMDISYPKVSKDYSAGNFSSLRMGDLDDRRHLQPIQRLIVDDIMKPIYDEFVQWCVLTGQISAPGFNDVRDLYTRAIFVPQPYEYSNPLDDAAADAKQLVGGMQSLKTYYDKRGKDWKEELGQIGDEQRFMRENEIQLNLFETEKTQVQTAADKRTD
jgi:lambda family phage portal protein